MKRIVLVLLVALMVMVSGCGGSQGVEPAQGDNVTNGSAQVKVLSQDEALAILWEELDATPDTADFMIDLLREARLGDDPIYVFQRVGRSGGASTTDFVHAHTGKVYLTSEELLLDQFNNSPDKAQYSLQHYLDKEIYSIEMNSINDPEAIQWKTFIVDGSTYPDLASAKQAAVASHIAGHPMLSLLGTPYDQLEGLPEFKVEDVEVQDVDGIEDFTTRQFTYKGAMLFFNHEDRVSEMLLDQGQELLGVTVGDTFDEIASVLGLPESLGQDQYYEDVFTAHYQFGDLSIMFYAESKDGPTVSVAIQKF